MWGITTWLINWGTFLSVEQLISRKVFGAIELDCDDDVLKEIAPVLRGNARAAQKMANNMKSYLQRTKSKKFSKKDWKALKYALGILPLGVSRIELQILRALAEKKESSLTNLSAKTGLTVQCIRQDFELYIQKHNLMEIATGGRSLTSVGHKYLEDLDSKVKPWCRWRTAMVQCP